MGSIVDSPVRDVYSRILRGRVGREAYAEVVSADAYLDEALVALGNEEPELARWLETDPDVRRLLRANKAAIFWLILNGMKHDLTLEEVVRRLDVLISRVVYGIAWRTALRSRPAVSLANDTRKDGHGR